MPRLMVAGLSGGSGKTILTLGLCRKIAQQGLCVKPFKKGPDYIDAAWMGLAAANRTSNLDPFFMVSDLIQALFAEAAQAADISIIEGNRGLFDGKDSSGSCSTAELARTLDAPVVLVVDCTKMTRTTAAVVKGCCGFEPGLDIAGVVLNRTAGQRHRQVIRASLEKYTDVPVLGALPKLTKNPIPERHMGLISDQEFAPDPALKELGNVVAEWVDLERIKEIAWSAPKFPAQPAVDWPKTRSGDRVRIGVVRDAALWFYYEENIEALRRAGAEVVEVSLLQEHPWPELHGLYLGGGFPETLAPRLSEQAKRRKLIAKLSNRGLPIYAECGGLLYLCQELIYQGQSYPMSGVFPIRAEMGKRPQGHGYTRAKVVLPNPFHPLETQILGHEFHYSRCHILSVNSPQMAMVMERGNGIQDKRDGYIQNNTFACYSHLHALSSKHWAPNFVQAAIDYKTSTTNADYLNKNNK